MATNSESENWEIQNKIKRKHDYGLAQSYDSVNDSASFLEIKGSDRNYHLLGETHSDYNFCLENSKSGPEFRFINPAIYMESFETKNRGDHLEDSVSAPHICSGQNSDHFLQQKIGSGDGSSSLTDGISVLSIKSNDEDSASTVNVDGDHAPGTYRCLPSFISTTISTQLNTNETHKPMKQTERRCKIDDLKMLCESKSSEDLHFMSAQLLNQGNTNVRRCSLNEYGMMQQSSTTSLSTCLSEERTLNGVPLSRKIAHEEWVREKERKALKFREERRLAEKKRIKEEERMKQEREEKERRERESFLKWAERKRRDVIAKKEALERETEFQKRLKELEDEAAVAKTIYIRQWARKKEEQQKAEQKKLQLQKQQEEEEKKKRLEESEKAYGKWRENTKDRPRPATQAHQKARPAFVNPQPWKRILPDEEQKNDAREPLEDPNFKNDTFKHGHKREMKKIR